jgi:hypothetical protein
MTTLVMTTSSDFEEDGERPQEAAAPYRRRLRPRGGCEAAAPCRAIWTRLLWSLRPCRAEGGAIWTRLAYTAHTPLTHLTRA